MSGRIRTLKPEWLDDEKLGSCSDAARLLHAALILMADDHGNGRAAHTLIRNRVWGYSETSRDPREPLAELSRVGLIRLYVVNGETYYTIPKWPIHQKVDKVGKPHVPKPDAEDTVYVSSDCIISSRDFRETVASSSETLGPDLRPTTSDQDLRPVSARRRSPAPKENPKGDHQEFVRHFDALFQEHQGCKPTWNGKTGTIVKRLLKAHGLEECKRRAVLLFTKAPAWMASRDLQTLEQHFDKLVAVQNGPVPVEHARMEKWG